MKTGLLLLVGLFISSLSFSQDSLMRHQIDSAVEFIETSDHLKVIADTIIHFDSARTWEVTKEYDTVIKYYDSSGRLVKVNVKFDFEGNKIFYYNHDFLIKVIKGPEIFYYDSYDNTLTNDTIQELLIARPDRTKFLTNLRIGMAFLQSSLRRNKR